MAEKAVKITIKEGKGEGQYLVESSSHKCKFYTIDMEKGSCSCPMWLLRMHRVGKCKHILAVEEKYKIKAKESAGDGGSRVKNVKTSKASESKAKELLEFVRKSKEVDSMELIGKFGDDAVDGLIASGDIIEEHGKIRLL